MALMTINLLVAVAEEQLLLVETQQNHHQV
jgi:hypothetical protein